MAKIKLDYRERKLTIPCAEQPVIYAHTCEINATTKLGSEAWHRRNGPGAQRVDAIRHLHAAAGSHERAVEILAEATQGNLNTTIDTVQTRTLVRAVKRVADV